MLNKKCEKNCGSSKNSPRYSNLVIFFAFWLKRRAPLASLAPRVITPNSPVNDIPVLVAAKTAERRKFRKLVNRSADKIRRNSTLKFYSSSTKQRRCQKRLCKTSTYSQSKGYKLIDSSILSQVFSACVCCSRCKSKGLNFEEYSGNKNGLAEFLRIRCIKCGFTKVFQSSNRVKSKKVYKINLRSVYASQPFGREGLGIIPLWYNEFTKTGG